MGEESAQEMEKEEEKEGLGLEPTAVEPTTHSHPPPTATQTHGPCPGTSSWLGIVPAPVCCKVRTHQSRKILLVLPQEQQHRNTEGSTEPGKTRLSRRAPRGVF